MEQSSKVILFREITPMPAQAGDSGNDQFIVLLGNLKMGYEKAAGPFNTFSSAMAWNAANSDEFGGGWVLKLSEPHELE
jgi:hypothetical protein